MEGDSRPADFRRKLRRVIALFVLVACGAHDDDAVDHAKTSDHQPGPPARDRISEVRVALVWDETTQTVHRKMGDREYPNDDDLAKAISEAHDAWVKKGKPDAPVTIDASSDIPWAEVIKVVNLIKKLGIDKIEFAMGAPAKRPK